jgi:hypothetical protein
LVFPFEKYAVAVLLVVTIWEGLEMFVVLLERIFHSTRAVWPRTSKWIGRLRNDPQTGKRSLWFGSGARLWVIERGGEFVLSEWKEKMAAQTRPRGRV